MMNKAGIFTSRTGLMRALLEVFIPSTAELPAGAIQRVLERSDELVAARPRAIQRQVVLAIRVLSLLAWLRHFRSLEKLDPVRRTAFLEHLQSSGLLKLRLAVWGLRTLLFAGYYGDPDRYPVLNYRPGLRGWEDWNGEADHEIG